MILVCLRLHPYGRGATFAPSGSYFGRQTIILIILYFAQCLTIGNASESCPQATLTVATATVAAATVAAATAAAAIAAATAARAAAYFACALLRVNS